MIKYLIIRFSSIGDIVLTTPVIRCLKKQVPDAEIHYLTKKSFAPILENNPYIDKLHILDNKISDTIEILKQEKFDYIIDLHHSIRSAMVKSKLRLVSFSFDKLNFKKWLLVNFKINKLPNVHIVDRYLDTVRFFDVVNDNEGLDYFIPDKDEVILTSLPEAYKKGYIAFVIGGKHKTKQLPVDKIVQICKKLPLPVILLGSEEDYTDGDQIKLLVGGNVINACGKYNINQSASLVKKSKLVITPDTGLMHVAAAFRKKIISVWGNTIPEFGMYPYMPDAASVIIENKGLQCRPCSKIGYEKCPKKHFKCMNDIDNNKIAVAAHDMIAT